MHQKLTLFILCLGTSLLFAQTTPPINGDIDHFVKEHCTTHGIPGASLAVIKDGTVIHQNHYGFANLPHEVPTGNHTVYRVYSLTKLIVSVGLFKLIEDGKLKLNAPIGNYLDDLPKAWRDIKVAQLITHASGLPDMVGNGPYELQGLTNQEAQDRVYKMPLRHPAGTIFEYNQTNYWLLKRIIETQSGKTLATYIAEHQFPDLSRNTPLFTHDSRDIVKHRATPYFPFLKGTVTTDLPYASGDYTFASNGLQLTLEDFVGWHQKFDANTLVSREMKEKMWMPYPYSETDDQFGYSWDIISLGEETAYGFSGSMCTMYRTYPSLGVTVIFLSN
ncbi:MAG: serine hydrolase domain-containing protein, partial [Bacteroidota bacterium]